MGRGRRREGRRRSLGKEPARGPGWGVEVADRAPGKAEGHPGLRAVGGAGGRV